MAGYAVTYAPPPRKGGSVAYVGGFDTEGEAVHWAVTTYGEDAVRARVHRYDDDGKFEELGFAPDLWAEQALDDWDRRRV